PVTPNKDFAVLPHKRVRRRQFGNARVHGVRGRDVEPRQVVQKGYRIQLSRYAIKLQQTLDFGGERQPGGSLRVVKLLDAEPVASQKNTTAARIEHGEAKHSPQMPNAFVTIFLV